MVAGKKQDLEISISRDITGEVRLVLPLKVAGLWSMIVVGNVVLQSASIPEKGTALTVSEGYYVPVK